MREAPVVAEVFMRFCFIHAADLHLDTPFSGVARVSEEMASLLRDASLQAFDQVVSLALERRAAFVLLAGDIYDGEERGVRAQLRFLRGVERLTAAGIKIFVVHGNHDPLGGWSAIRRWPEGVTIFGPKAVQGVPVFVDGQKAATVYGLSYDRREVTENLARRFWGVGGSAAEDGLRVGLLHCSVGHYPEHSPYSPCSLADLVEARMDYWALGHIHRQAVLAQGKPWVVYAGNTQGRSPKPAEMGPKGAMVVECEDTTVLRVEHVPTDSVRFVELRLDVGTLAEQSDLAGLQEALLAQAAQLRRDNEGRALIVRALLEGKGPVHHDLVRPGAISELLRDLRDAFVGENPPLWWESLQDHTRPEIDLDVIRARDDFFAALLAHWEALARDADQRAGLVAQLTPSR
ncbi:MAG: DNA repair exonuclease, partial [Thermoleophilia bacterium]|nr:DNA repair exonuclease [Thermoleophilia bacterium]